MPDNIDVELKKITMKKMCVLFMLFVESIFAQNYPFALPETITVSLSVDRRVSEPFNNNLIGVNITWPGKLGYGGRGFNHPDAKTFMRKFKPVAVRFPDGVWSNFYDWQLDGRRRYDDYNNKEWTDVIEKGMKLRHGFDGLHELYKELKFGVVWPYNVLYDSNEKSVARMLDRQKKGFNVDNIEMGNEIFWLSQRSQRTSTPVKYVVIAKSLSSALRKANPNVKVSIPISWRGHKHDDYNKILTRDQSYFDAISVHLYLHFDRESETVSAESYRKTLTARLQLKKDIDYCRSFGPGKPIWMTEWGVGCGFKAASYLGMADAYLSIFENQDIYGHTCWFQINNVNSFYLTRFNAADKSRTITKTGFGAVYDVLRDVFQDSLLLKSDMTTWQLAKGSDAVVGRAAVKNGKTAVFAVNKTPRPAAFTLKFNDVTYSKSCRHEALKFDSLTDNPSFAAFENPLKLVKESSGTITLPPYSVNKISNFAFDNE